MLRSIAALTATVALGVTLGAGPAVADNPPRMLGPGDAGVSNIKDEALIRMSKWGYVYIAGQQNSHLTITFKEDANALLYRDTGTQRLTTIPQGCTRKKAKKGIAVQCTIPKKFASTRMHVQVWPRLGDDFVDGRTLPRRFRLWALVDAGRDVVFGGAGNDFVNGAFDGDRVYGGPGHDFLRTGPGNDQIWGGTGRDRLSCAEDYDIAYRDSGDSMYLCESVRTG